MAGSTAGEQSGTVLKKELRVLHPDLLVEGERLDWIVALAVRGWMLSPNGDINSIPS